MQATRILLVEDDKTMMRIVLDMLDMLGYDVQPAYSAEEALGYLEREQFAALVADVVLSGMSGIELARQVHAASPATRIIFTTGSGYLLSPSLPFNFTLLSKPFYLVHLLEVLREVPVYRTSHTTAPRSPLSHELRTNELCIHSPAKSKQRYT